MNQPQHSTTEKPSKALADYEAALDRLLNNQPTHPELIEIKEANGFVPITQDSVAKEARRKRGRIAGPNSDFPQLAQRIKKLRPTHGVSPNTAATLKGLRADIATLQQRLVAARSRLAESALRIEDLTTQLDESQEEIARLKGRR
jgi:chromosome segregation ATPase